MKIIEHKNLFLLIAAGILTVSVALVVGLGLKLGIDFTGGALTEVSYSERPAQEVFTDRLDTIELGSYSLRESQNDAGQEVYLSLIHI